MMGGSLPPLVGGGGKYLMRIYLHLCISNSMQCSTVPELPIVIFWFVHKGGGGISIY